MLHDDLAEIQSLLSAARGTKMSFHRWRCATWTSTKNRFCWKRNMSCWCEGCVLNDLAETAWPKTVRDTCSAKSTTGISGQCRS